MKKYVLLLAAALIMGGVSCAKQPAQNVNTAAEPAVDTTAAEAAAEEGGAVVKSIDAAVAGKDILPAIMANYKDQVVLLDFWATWCPPCRRAMVSIDEIKAPLAEKGCKFVYITGETSPLADWKKQIPAIAGDHFRLTDKQWGELCKELNIPGIPVYVLMGKDGKMAYDNLKEGGYPGSEVLKNNIEVALTK